MRSALSNTAAGAVTVRAGARVLWRVCKWVRLIYEKVSVLEESCSMVGKLIVVGNGFFWVVQ